MPNHTHFLHLALHIGDLRTLEMSFHLLDGASGVKMSLHMEGSAYANRQNLTRSIEVILSIDLISSLAEGRCQWHTEYLKEEQEAAVRGKSHRDKDGESQQ